MSTYDINLKVNNNITEENTVFYKLTSGTSYSVDIVPYSYTISSLISSASTNVWYTLNGSLVTYNSISSTTFNCTNPCVCSISVYLSSTTVSPTISASVSAVFVSYFLSAGSFELFPTIYFDSYGSTFTLSSTNYRTNTNGVLFYGEGHTETINLTALSALSIGQSYIWNVKNNTQTYTPSANNPTYSIVPIQSFSGVINIIPVGLQIIDSKFTSNSPIFYRDDITGNKTYYSHYVSTVDPNNVEYATNTKTFGSIKVLIYDSDINYTFSSGVETNSYIELPTTQDLSGNYTPQTFNAILNFALSGESINTCYGLYDTVWNWDSLKREIPTNTFTGKPSSWNSVANNSNSSILLNASLSVYNISATNGVFPKTWNTQSILVSGVSHSPITKVLSSTTWIIDDPSWETTPYTITSPSNSQIFPYTLDYSSITQNVTSADINNITVINVSATSLVYCKINASPNDWNGRLVTINNLDYFNILPIQNVKLYTPNKYILLGDSVYYELVTNASTSNLFIDDGENAVTDITGFYTYNVVYNNLGSHTVTVSAISILGKTQILEFKNVVNVLSQYDATNILESEYRTINSPLEIPYPQTPYIAPNEWIVEDNINSIISKMNDNLNYLNVRSLIISNDIEYYGWLGSLGSASFTCNNYKTWTQLMCDNTSSIQNTWEDFTCSDGTLLNGRLSACAKYENLMASESQTTQNCLGLYCIPWNWSSLKSSSQNNVTWKQTKEKSSLAKTWNNDGNCISNTNTTITTKTCLDVGQWNVNIQDYNSTIIDNTYNTIRCGFNITNSCIYKGIVSRDNLIYSILDTQLMVLSSDYTGSIISKATKTYYDGLINFVNLKGIAIDSVGKIFLLDNTLGKVIGLNFDLSYSDPWYTSAVWGGIGGANSNSKFYNPNDIHIDKDDHIYITDMGNNCIKKFNNNGIWLATIFDPEFINNAPLSVTVDSDGNLHVLTNKEVRIYKNEIYISSYVFSEYTSQSPIKISANYIRNCVYITFKTQVIKFFKNGVFSGYILDGTKSCVENLICTFQDEHRNLLIADGDKIIKFIDILTQTKTNSNLPNNYWILNDMLIHKDEYVQNWVYNKALQKVWDEIEMFRGTLLFNNSKCKSISTYTHPKNKIFIGQNEIVTNTVINRLVGYLWDNFNTIIPFFNPNCG